MLKSLSLSGYGINVRRTPVSTGASTTGSCLGPQRCRHYHSGPTPFYRICREMKEEAYETLRIMYKNIVIESKNKS